MERYALADIDALQSSVARRIDAERWPPLWLGLVLGALAASLAWRNIVLFIVVAVAYLVSLLPLVGTPTRFGVVPRSGPGSFVTILVAVAFVAGTPMLAVTGPWWMAIVAGVGAAVFVPLFGRWRRVQQRRSIAGPAVLPPTALMRRVDVVAPRPEFAPVAAVVMTGAVLGMWSGWSALAFAFLPGALLLQRRQLLVGGLPPAERTGRFRAAAFGSALVFYGTPPLVTLVGPEHVGLPAAVVHAAVVAGTVLLVGRWQQRRLS
jgi:hypothetical protein